jgi:hypothetical protein
MNFNPSTQEMLSYIRGGLRVETSTLAAATYLLGAANTQTELFTVKGRILVLQLYLEVISALSAHAQQVLFNCTFTTPAIAVNAMCAKCASTSGLGQGGRIVLVGGAVATAAVITDSAGLSDVTCVTPHIVGGHEFTGSIGILSSDASHNAGTFRGILHYIPYSDGAYAEARL